MTEAELQERVNEFQRALESAQDKSGLPSMVVYAFTAPKVGTLGGELVAGHRPTDTNTTELSLVANVTLLSYLQARIDVLKLEASAMFGPTFTALLNHEITAQVAGMSASERTALQQGVVDLAVANRPCIALAASPATTTRDGAISGDFMAQIATGQTSVPDLIPVYAVLLKAVEGIIDDAADHVGVDRTKLRAEVEQVKSRLV